MEIIFLGTSGSVPNKKRNLPSVALIYQGNQILFDAGEDVQRRFEDASLKFNAPLSIFISHLHGDHIIGLPGLLFHFSLIHRTQDIVIYGPKGTYLYLLAHKLTLGLKVPFLKCIIEIDHERDCLLKYNARELNEVKPSEAPINGGILVDNDKFIIKYTAVDHSVPSYGYKFIEKPHLGTFNPIRAKQLGIPRGRLWKKLQLGETIKFQDKVIDPNKSNIIGKKREGFTIAYSSDTKICEGLYKLAADSDIFICESTYTDELNHLADEKKHMTAKNCALVSRDSNVKLLILTHISTRYSNYESVILKEAKYFFTNTILAYDLLRIEAKVSKEKKIVKIQEV
jgi:ribonuclease Z